MSREEEPNRGARLAGTALVACGAIVLIVLATVALFFLIASLLGADWIAAVLSILALVALFWLINRFIRVAANQNKNPLG